MAEFVHRHSSAKLGLQLGHSGRKGSSKLMWEGINRPRDHENLGGRRPVAAALRSREPRPRLELVRGGEPGTRYRRWRP